MMSKVEDVDKKKAHEEIMRNNWYYLEPTGNSKSSYLVTKK